MRQKHYVKSRTPCLPVQCFSTLVYNWGIDRGYILVTLVGRVSLNSNMGKKPLLGPWPSPANCSAVWLDWVLSHLDKAIYYINGEQKIQTMKCDSWPLDGALLHNNSKVNGNGDLLCICTQIKVPPKISPLLGHDNLFALDGHWVSTPKMWVIQKPFVWNLDRFLSVSFFSNTWKKKREKDSWTTIDTWTSPMAVEQIVELSITYRLRHFPGSPLAAERFCILHFDG